MNFTENVQENMHSSSVAKTGYNSNLTTPPVDLNASKIIQIQQILDNMLSPEEEEENIRKNNMETTRVIQYSLLDIESSLAVLPKDVIFEILIIKELLQNNDLLLRIKETSQNDFSDMNTKMSKMLRDELRKFR